MYSITLNTCASILLLSSVITMIILLRKQIKQLKKKPLYILSMSDVLFSMFTSSILFINCVEQINYTIHNEVNNTYPITNSIWNAEDDNENQQIKYKGFIENFNTALYQNNSNVIVKCNITSIIFKYGTLFLPFANSFVSLLMFSVQCNLNVFDLKNQCFKFLQSQEKMCKDDTSTNKSNTETQFDSVVNLLKSKEVSIIKRNMKKILRVFKIKKDNKFTAIFVLSQWIVPIFVTGLLYLADYDKSSTEDIKNVKCFIESIFFFDDCHNNTKSISISQSVDFKTYTTPPYRDYINNEDLVTLKNSNDTEVNEIISKIQNLVYSVMNDTSTTSFNIISYNISEPLDITNYLELNTYTKIIEQNNSMENKPNLVQDTSLTKQENSNNLIDIQKNTNLQSTLPLNNYTDEDDSKESILFNYLMMNSSKDISQEEENYEHEITIDTIEKLDFKESQTNVTKNQDTVDDLINVTTKYNTSIISNDQIYAEILKRIHNIPIYHTLQNYYKNKDHGNKKQQREFKPKDFQHNSTLDKQSVVSDIKIIINQNDNTSKIMQTRVTDKCFISMQFLKLHLLALVFIIYFLPILFSSILQQHGRLNCQMILEKLKTKNKIVLNNFNLDFINEINDICCNISMDSKGPSTSKQGSKCSNENLQETTNFDRSQSVETRQEDCNKKWDEHNINDQHFNISFDETEMELNMINQMENMLKIFDVIKMSLLCGILLWTPLIFEFLIKVFVSLHVPERLLNTTYLVAILFNTLRNIFNLRMIKFQEINTSATKTNSIHPIT